jgi:hypothetical protein
MPNEKQMQKMVPPPPPYTVTPTELAQMPQYIPNQPAQALPPVGGPTYGVEFAPPPPVQSLTPMTMGELGGIPQPPPSSLMQHAGNAEQVFRGQGDYNKSRELLHGVVDEKHLQRRRNIESQVAELAGSLGLDIDNPAAMANALAGITSDNAANFGANGGLITRMLTFGARQKAAVQANQRANVATRVSVLRFLKDAMDSEDTAAINVATQLMKLGSDWKDLLKQDFEIDKFNRTDARLNEALDQKGEFGQMREERLNKLASLKEQMTPAQIAALEALTGQRQVATQKGQAELPYVAPQAAAKLSLTREQAAAVAPRTAAMGMAASGVAATPEMMAEMGLQSAPPDATTPGASLAAAPLTPKLQANEAKTQAQIEATQANTQKVTAQAGLEIEKLRKRATRSAETFAASGRSGAEYWRKNPQAWDLLPQDTKQKLLQLELSGAKPIDPRH